MTSVQQPIVGGLAHVQHENAFVRSISSVLSAGRSQSNVLHCCINTISNSMVLPCRLSANKMSCSSGAPREEPHTALRYVSSAQDVEKDESAQAQP